MTLPKQPQPHSPSSTTSDQPDFINDLPDVDGHIIGGKKSKLNEHPYTVALLAGKYGNQKDLAGGAFCGGSLINSFTVLTAAHCFGNFGYRSGKYGEGQLYVSTGRTRLSTKVSSAAKRCARTIEVHSVIIHENYDPSNQVNDIAIMYLKSPARCYPKRSRLRMDNDMTPSAHEDRMATIMGWGARNASHRRDIILGKFPEFMHEVDLSVRSHEYCFDAWKNRGSAQNPLIFNQKHLCADRNGKDSCSGDSGGPLILKQDNGDRVQIGIVSWSIGCANIGVASGRNSPGVYTRVAKYHSWIEKHTKKWCRDIIAYRTDVRDGANDNLGGCNQITKDKNCDYW
eukprot:CAMPEP_0119304720 /NCGR_PEP_ID=MMETSP1333-20130426/5870_1 /TAXON_ID=418940 /ORGANISM="Scyphosphaera apsteinii, Strain RCC1455" /LENGTH=341 /DNA_ID=CAMNT_0007307651 /DNA_START=80 /DNA_END=1102 /DNA_ORIENTATION=-